MGRDAMLRSIGPEDIWRGADAGEPAGYGHPSYIQSLSEFGTPIELPSAAAWLLVRAVPGSDQADAIGAYPFFVCADYGQLGAELSRLTDLVSVGVVPDPFSVGATSALSAAFGHVIPFKTQYIADLEIAFSRYVHRHHRRYASRGLANFDIERAATPGSHGAEWAQMYQNLIVRHRISGLRAFSPYALGKQLEVPGCRYFRAVRDGVVQGALVCYIDRGVAYAHLISTTATGQELFAQYALYWAAIEHCRDHARWFALGSVPGVSDDGNGGLSFFKAGWATATCQGYFCGHASDPERYEALCAISGRAGAGFPAYRHDPLS
jgi:hypothetical protein